MSPDAKAPTNQPSLGRLRVAAAVGVIAAIVLVVAGFSSSLLLGVLALIAAPVVPLAFVMVADRLWRS